MPRRPPDGETEQIKAFLSKGHPWLAFAVKLVPTFRTLVFMLAAIGLAVMAPQVASKVELPMVSLLK